MTDHPKHEQVISQILDAAFEVHSHLGPGLLERVYHFCLVAELESKGLKCQQEARFDIHYKCWRMKDRLRLDLVVEDCALVELKSVEKIQNLHLQQGSTYLALSGLPAGVMLNFNTTALKHGIRRIYPPDRIRGRTYYTDRKPEPFDEHL